MYAYVALFALAQTISSVSTQPDWQTDYAKALKAAKESQKSLVVVIGEGKEGWNNLSNTGKLNGEALKVLKDKYVCLYVDAKQPENVKLASAFEATRLPTLVVSDKTGGYQVHRQAGPADEAQLKTSLERYVAYQVPQDVITRTSYYQGGAAPATTTSCASGSCSTNVWYGGGCATGSCGASYSCGSSGGCYSGGYRMGGCFSGGYRFGGGCGIRSGGFSYGGCGFGGGCGSCR